MKLHCLEMHNILSIEHATIKFGDSGLVLVEGYDYDTGRANGAGKSAIFNGLSFALFDKVPRRITKSEILRKGTQSGFAFVEVETPMGLYGVKRGRPISTIYYKDGKEVDMTQEEFEKVIGLNYEQFLVTMYTAQDTPDKFINLNDTAKKAFLLKIMGLSKFTKAKEQASELQKSLTQQKELIKAKLEGLKSNIAIYRDSLVDPVAIQSRIDQNNKDIISYTSEIKKLQDIKEPDLSKYTETENKVNEKLMYFMDTKVKLNNERREHNRYSQMVGPFNPSKPDATCPACQAELNIQGKTLAKADDVEALKKQWESHQAEIKNIITQHASKINEYETALLKEPELQELVKKIKIKKQEEYTDYNSAQSSISEYRNSINLKVAENNSLTAQISRNDDIKLKVKDIVEAGKALNTKLTEVDDELFLLDAVESVFDSTGAPAYVMDSITDSFNEAVSDYIGEVWPNATYVLQTYKENKDKSVKAKFSETLTIDGKERSIGSLSGGEVRALSLALDFAIVEVLSSQYGLSLNPIILDEPFNGLDATGREMIIDILTKFSQTRQVWVVDHASESKAMFNKTVRVEKRNGISKIA